MAELGEALSAEELRDWMAFDALEPIGHRRDDLNAGLIASTIANVNRGRGSRVFRPADFMIDFDGRLVEARRVRAAVDMRAFFERHNERMSHGHQRR